MDESVLRGLREHASSRGTSLNDLLVRDLFISLNDWNRKRDQSADNRWLRLNLPINLRTPAHESLSAANVISYAFLDRRPTDLAHPDALLSSISQDMRAVQKDKLSLYFLYGLGVATSMPRLFSAVVKIRRCMATAVMSYLGDPSRRFVGRLPRRGGKIVSGNLVIEQIIGCPPIRDRTCAAMSVGTYGGELALGMQCDPKHFSNEDSQELLETYASQLRATAAAHTIEATV